MKKACVSLAELYKSDIKEPRLGGHIRFTEENGNTYYDLINDNGELILCDGEECLILFHNKNEKYYILASKNRGVFYVTDDEYDIAVFEDN